MLEEVCQWGQALRVLKPRPLPVIKCLPMSTCLPLSPHLQINLFFCSITLVMESYHSNKTRFNCEDYQAKILLSLTRIQSRMLHSSERRTLPWCYPTAGTHSPAELMMCLRICRVPTRSLSLLVSSLGSKKASRRSGEQQAAG